jgi:hypothetical protein
MTAPRILLTVQLQSTICGYILCGSYPHIAAEAAGVPREVFEDWMKRGGSKRGAKKYQAFREAVLQAQAQARLAAESRALSGDPLTWLKCGPGKDSPESPGWSNPGRGEARKGEGDCLMQKEFQDLVALLLRVLQPYPEARTAVAEELVRQEQTQKSAEPEPAEDE